ncbi:hypothetical protein IX51_05915 [uncultured archaeon]|nr:hypothetical protein IX51_05915 [uncultured archaeon]
MGFYGFTLEKELFRLDNSALDGEVKKKIREFIDDIKLKDNLSENRLYYYAVRIRKVAEILGDKCLTAEAPDLKRAISEISSRKHKNGIKYSENTIEDYKIAVKRFYRWLISNDGEVPENVKWIKKKRVTNRHVKPDALITEAEMSLIVQNCKNARDKALFSLLYDSGCRIGELMTLKNKDVDFDQYGAVLSVTGKTGYRKVRVVGNSVPYLREWQNSHPHRNDEEFRLFCGISDNTRNKAMTYDDLHSALKKTLKRAGIKRRIYPHLFRHTRATILASKVTEAPLEAQMGWIHGSRMTQTYVHLSGRDQDNAILKAYSIDVKDEGLIQSERPSACPRCNEPNDRNSRFCWKCGMILDKTLTNEKLKEEADKIEESVLESEAVDDTTKSMIKSFSPEYKDLILEVVLSDVFKNSSKLEKIREELARKGMT